MSGPPAALTLETVNGLSEAAFVAALGGVFERSPWVAALAWTARPFAGVDALHRAMVDAVRGATADERLALLRAHPDLAGRVARAAGGEAARVGAMTASSRAEQSSAGLDRLSEVDHERFHRLNAAYRERFGFPFIVAVRRHHVASILAVFEARLGRSRDDEIDAALAEVFEIARLRLDGLLGAA